MIDKITNVETFGNQSVIQTVSILDDRTVPQCRSVMNDTCRLYDRWRLISSRVSRLGDMSPSGLYVEAARVQKWVLAAISLNSISTSLVTSRHDTTRSTRRAHAFCVCRACRTARLDTLDATSSTGSTRSS